MEHHPWTQPYREVVEQQFRLDEASRAVFGEFFARLDKMAASSEDQAAFANQFMASPLYAEYTGLFQKYSKFVVAPDGKTVTETSASLRSQAAQAVPGMMASSAVKREANRIVSEMLPDEVNRVRWAGLRALPVIGPIVQWMDNLNLLRNFFKR
ncbi:MAG: hypothetical protein IJ551_04915 [Prevotella sp.]|nr:hypothetical protein [Prevotella sp.]